MNRDCLRFRGLLERLLGGTTAVHELGELGWHEHLLSCGDCRELLHEEEALEELLASLPVPRLPEDLTRRVLVRLRAARQDGLDQLLELDEAEAPADLPRRVIAGVAAAQEQERMERRLDAWLDAAGEVQVPAGLADRVLSGVAARRAVSAPGGFSALRSVRVLAAAALVAALALGAFWQFFPAREPDAEVAGADHGAEERSPFAGAGPGDELPEELPDEGLLAALDVLENWELVAPGEGTDEDPNVAAFYGFDVSDEALLEFVELDELGSRPEGDGDSSR